MKNRTYDILRYIAETALPALGTLYFALSQIWGFPYGEEIVGTITAVDACLGVLLKISKAKYNGTEEGQTVKAMIEDYSTNGIELANDVEEDDNGVQDI